MGNNFVVAVSILTCFATIALVQGNSQLLRGRIRPRPSKAYQSPPPPPSNAYDNHYEDPNVVPGPVQVVPAPAPTLSSGTEKFAGFLREVVPSSNSINESPNQSLRKTDQSKIASVPTLTSPETTEPAVVKVINKKTTTARTTDTPADHHASFPQPEETESLPRDQEVQSSRLELIQKLCTRKYGSPTLVSSTTSTSSTPRTTTTLVSSSTPEATNTRSGRKTKSKASSATTTTSSSTAKPQRSGPVRRKTTRSPTTRLGTEVDDEVNEAPVPAPSRSDPRQLLRRSHIRVARRVRRIRTTTPSTTTSSTTSTTSTTVPAVPELQGLCTDFDHLTTEQLARRIKSGRRKAPKST